MANQKSGKNNFAPKQRTGSAAAPERGTDFEGPACLPMTEAVREGATPTANVIDDAAPPTPVTAKAFPDDNNTDTDAPRASVTEVATCLGPDAAASDAIPRSSAPTTAREDTTPTVSAPPSTLSTADGDSSPTSARGSPPSSTARPSKLTSLSVTPAPNGEREVPDEFALFRDNPFYLGSSGVEKRVGWVHIDKAQHLVSSEDASAAKENRLSQPTPVVLSLVTQITREDCWLAPDGNWNGKRPNGPEFQNIRLSFMGGPPSCHPVLDNDFKSALEHMERILRSVAIPGGFTEGGLMVTNGFGGQQKKFRFRHMVFQRATEEDGDQGKCLSALPFLFRPSNLATDEPQDLTIDKWPVRSDAARDTLAEILSTHIVRPLNAHDVNGKLIEPERYEAALRGATVLLSFTVTHYRITSNNRLKDVYCFDIDSISVLVPPDPVPAISPKRSRVRQTDPLAAQLGPAFKKLKQT